MAEIENSEDSDNNTKSPSTVIHELCGEAIFLYFGSDEQLKNIEDLVDEEGCLLTRENIRICAKCGEKIQLSKLKIIKKEPIECSLYIINEIISPYIMGEAEYIGLDINRELIGKLSKKIVMYKK